jgi:protoporphyrinogen oxidase
MNTSTKTASSKLFIEMMKIIFFEDKKNSNFVIPKVDLNNSLINPALSFLKAKGVKISTSERLIAINLNEGKAIEIETNKRKISDFDAIISSIPLFSLSKIIFGNSHQKFTLPKLEYSPIVTVHVWLTENPLKEKMYNLIGSEFDWVFNHKTHLSFVKSNAKKLTNLNKNIVIKIVFSELKKYFTILTKTEIKDYIVLKEIHATFIPDLNSNEARKSLSKIANNLYIIGDWTNTGLPATIEGAIKSGNDITQKITFK